MEGRARMLDRAFFPPSDLGARRLPLEGMPTGGVLFRMHLTVYGAKFFGRTGWRFDSPARASYSLRRDQRGNSVRGDAFARARSLGRGKRAS